MRIIAAHSLKLLPASCVGGSTRVLVLRSNRHLTGVETAHLALGLRVNHGHERSAT